MPSSSPSRFSTVAVFSASVVAAATVSGYVVYFNGNTYQAGTSNATTQSGATVNASTLLTSSGTLSVEKQTYLQGSTQILATSYPGLYVLGTETGNVLHAEKFLTSSGALKVVGSAFFVGTQSGNILHIEKTTTLSGAVKIANALTVTGTQTGDTLFLQKTFSTSGAIKTTSTLSGAQLTLNKRTAGSGKLVIHGSAGSYICMRQAAGVYMQLSIVAGAVKVNAADANTCP